MEAVLIFPHQLFSESPVKLKSKHLFFVEDPLFFCDAHYPAKFHKQKLVLHRATMQHHYDTLCKKHQCTYINYADAETEKVFNKIKRLGGKTVHVIDPVDFILRKRITNEGKKAKISIEWYESPNFLTTHDELQEYFEDRKRYHQTDFYKYQRKKFDILMDDEKPLGGHWTYDVKNRKKLPKGNTPPAPLSFKASSKVLDAIEYVQSHFPEHYGCTEAFDYPVTRPQALKLLTDFIENRIEFFGPYQDAITNRSDYVYHSKLSSSLNIGLLSPMEVVKHVIDAFQDNKLPIESVEGFVRQVIGWREFVRGIYTREGVVQRTTNFLKLHRKLSSKWYKGELGIPPVDDVIKKAERTAYAHHIERLMIVGNFMLLCDIDPDQVYRWFMEMFIDSYDWVMVPNVYGMSQYADGGIMVTKPYVSGSNYIKTMSDYTVSDTTSGSQAKNKKCEWAVIWDGLYWRFLHNNKKTFSKNPRMSLVLKQLENMSAKTIQNHLNNAESFLETI